MVREHDMAKGLQEHTLPLFPSEAVNHEAEEAVLAAICAMATDSQEQQQVTHWEVKEHSRDIWKHPEVLKFVQHRELSTPITAAEAKRIRKWGSQYANDPQGKLLRRMLNGEFKVVPPPEERFQLIMDTHSRTGHFGVRRTTALLATSYWWYGMGPDVQQVLGMCELCRQIEAQPQKVALPLQSLPIKGMFYRWGVDLAGPLRPSKDGNRYLMIAIEHFSKQLEVVALPDKLASTTSKAFLKDILCRYGAPAEVLTDRGSEFQQEFSDLLEMHHIDHRMTSANHPQADGLAERAVQTVKKALRKLCSDPNTADSWDIMIHWVALGYRCSPQKSTGVSPYRMLHGTDPIIPPAVRHKFEKPHLDLMDEETTTRYLLARAAELQQHVAIATKNLELAQKRDQNRYRMIRSGAYNPKLHRYKPGDFVYCRRSARDYTLQPKYQPYIYRIREVRDSGVLLLQGKCGNTFTEHVNNVAPCYLTNIDTTMELGASQLHPSKGCTVCSRRDRLQEMYICGWCIEPYHESCLPDGAANPADFYVWLCPECNRRGVTEQDVVNRRADDVQLEGELPHIVHPSQQQLKADEEAKLLDGRVVCKLDGDQEVYGILDYVGRRGQRRPKYYIVQYSDGTQGELDHGTAKKQLVGLQGAYDPSALDPGSIASRLRREVAYMVTESHISASMAGDPWYAPRIPTALLLKLLRVLDVGKPWSVHLHLHTEPSLPKLADTLQVQHFALPPAVRTLSYPRCIDQRADVLVSMVPAEHLHVALPLMALFSNQAAACLCTQAHLELSPAAFTAKWLRMHEQRHKLWRLEIPGSCYFWLVVGTCTSAQMQEVLRTYLLRYPVAVGG
jgi:hypothetical protein